MHKNIDTKKGCSIGSEVYLIEVNTLKRFLEKELNNMGTDITFSPCPDAKKHEVLDKSKGKKKQNAEWFLSLQLDMFGESPIFDDSKKHIGKLTFSVLNEQQGGFFIDGEAVVGGVVKIDKNPSGLIFAVISEAMSVNGCEDIFNAIKEFCVKTRHKKGTSSKILFFSEASNTKHLIDVGCVKNDKPSKYIDLGL